MVDRQVHYIDSKGKIYVYSQQEWYGSKRAEIVRQLKQEGYGLTRYDTDKRYKYFASEKQYRENIRPAEKRQRNQPISIVAEPRPEWATNVVNYESLSSTARKNLAAGQIERQQREEQLRVFAGRGEGVSNVKRKGESWEQFAARGGRLGPEVETIRQFESGELKTDESMYITNKGVMPGSTYKYILDEQFKGKHLASWENKRKEQLMAEQATVNVSDFSDFSQTDVEKQTQNIIKRQQQSESRLKVFSDVGSEIGHYVGKPISKFAKWSYDYSVLKYVIPKSIKQNLPSKTTIQESTGMAGAGALGAPFFLGEGVGVASDKTYFMLRNWGVLKDKKKNLVQPFTTTEFKNIYDPRTAEGLTTYTFAALGAFGPASNNFLKSRKGGVQLNVKGRKGGRGPVFQDPLSPDAPLPKTSLELPKSQQLLTNMFDVGQGKMKRGATISFWDETAIGRSIKDAMRVVKTPLQEVKQSMKPSQFGETVIDITPPVEYKYSISRAGKGVKNYFDSIFNKKVSAAERIARVRDKAMLESTEGVGKPMQLSMFTEELATKLKAVELESDSLLKHINSLKRQQRLDRYKAQMAESEQVIKWQPTGYKLQKLNFGNKFRKQIIYEPIKAQYYFDLAERFMSQGKFKKGERAYDLVFDKTNMARWQNNFPNLSDAQSLRIMESFLNKNNYLDFLRNVPKQNKKAIYNQKAWQKLNKSWWDVIDRGRLTREQYDATAAKYFNKPEYYKYLDSLKQQRFQDSFGKTPRQLGYKKGWGKQGSGRSVLSVIADKIIPDTELPQIKIESPKTATKPIFEWPQGTRFRPRAQRGGARPPAPSGRGMSHPFLFPAVAAGSVVAQVNNFNVGFLPGQAQTQQQTQSQGIIQLQKINQQQKNQQIQIQEQEQIQRQILRSKAAQKTITQQLQDTALATVITGGVVVSGGYSIFGGGGAGGIAWPDGGGGGFANFFGGKPRPGAKSKYMFSLRAFDLGIKATKKFKKDGFLGSGLNIRPM